MEGWTTLPKVQCDSHRSVWWPICLCRCFFRCFCLWTEWWCRGRSCGCVSRVDHSGVGVFGVDGGRVADVVVVVVLMRLAVSRWRTELWGRDSRGVPEHGHIKINLLILRRNAALYLLETHEQTDRSYVSIQNYIMNVFHCCCTTNLTSIEGVISIVNVQGVHSRLTLPLRNLTYVCIIQVIQGFRAALVRTSQAERADVTAGLCWPLNVSYRHTEM